MAPLGYGPVEPAQAQLPDPEIPEIPELPGLGPETGIDIIGTQERSFANMKEGDVARFPIKIVDTSIESAMLYTSDILLRCDVVNQTNGQPIRNWAFGLPNPGSIGRNSEKSLEVTLSAGHGASPMIFSIEVVCSAGPPVNDVIAKFSFTGKLDIYQRFSLLPGGAPHVGPDEKIILTPTIANNGNDIERYQGRVDAPEGFIFEQPPAVLVPPGERREVEIHGVTPRDQIWIYPAQMMPVHVTYWPESGGASEQTRSIGVIMGGFYLHPALVPLILLALAALAVLVMVLIYARRTVEEQVLGKPMPPWRIPVEREYLKRLETEDPDEFYIVRYHLMVEEHQSALLWYKHFKHATRKDRKLERKWLKKTEKVKVRTERLRNRQEHLERRMARRLRVLPRRRRRHLERLNSKLMAALWREQRQLLKIHRKAVLRMNKIHSKKAKAQKKQALAVFAKERKQVEKKNKKLIRDGEDPLPMPQEPSLDLGAPEFPQVVEVPIVPIEQSQLAVKAQRISGRYNRRIARRTRIAKKRMRKKGAKRENKANRFKSKIPQAPSTHLYEEDKFIPEDEVVVEDSRPAVHKALGIPPLETREALRRRRMVYKVRIRQARHEKDTEQVERLKQEFEKEREQLLAKFPKASSKRSNDKEGPDAPAKDEATGDVEGSGGGGLRFLRRKGRARAGADDGDDEGKDARGKAEGGGDAANQAAKEEGPLTKKDGSSGEGRTSED